MLSPQNTDNYFFDGMKILNYQSDSVRELKRKIYKKEYIEMIRGRKRKRIHFLFNY